MGQTLPMFPLSTVLFPDAVLPLHVFEPRYRVMINECLEADHRFGVVLISRGSEVGGGDTRVSIGTTGRVERAVGLPDGRWMLVVRGEHRFRVTQWLPDDPYPRARVNWLTDTTVDGAADVSASLRSATAAVRRARALLSELRDVPAPAVEGTSDASTRSWWLCEHAPLTALDRQRLLECDDLGSRLVMVSELAHSVAEDLSRLLARG